MFLTVFHELSESNNFRRVIPETASACGIHRCHLTELYRRDLGLESGLPLLRPGETQVKAKIMLGLVVVVLGTAFAATGRVSGDPIPPCKPGVDCQVGVKTFDGGPDPLCRPNGPCPGGPGGSKEIRK